MEGAKSEFIVGKEEIDKPIDFAALIEKSIKEKHAEGADLPYLFKYIAASTEEEKKDVEGTFLKVKENTPNDPLILFQENLFQLMQAKDQAQAFAILNTILSKLPSTLPKNLQFIADLKDFQKLVSQDKPKDQTKWQIVDTDDPNDLLLAGEVLGSCQNVRGDPNLNKCLLAYMIDGKNRLLAIKNEKGEIKVRSILRLLWDGSRPVLFLERIYPSILDENSKNQLINFAKERATALNIPLVSVEVGDDEIKYPHPVSSLSSKAPFEYVDASDNSVTTGEWSVSNANLLQ